MICRVVRPGREIDPRTFRVDVETLTRPQPQPTEPGGFGPPFICVGDIPEVHKPGSWEQMTRALADVLSWARLCRGARPQLD